MCLRQCEGLAEGMGGEGHWHGSKGTGSRNGIIQTPALPLTSWRPRASQIHLLSAGDPAAGECSFLPHKLRASVRTAEMTVREGLSTMPGTESKLALAAAAVCTL